MTIAAVRSGVEAALSTLDGGSVQQEWGTSPNVSGNRWVAVVEFDGAAYDAVSGGLASDLTLKITVLASKFSDRKGREVIDALADPTPTSATALRHAVNGNLGGAAHFATVTSVSGYREYVIGEPPMSYLGAEWSVSVAV